jgi:putative transposase
MAGEGLPVQVAVRVLAVSESGYYDALTRPPSARSIRHAWLTDQIREVHVTSNGTYGARRVHAELTLGRGLVVSHGTIELLMSRAGIRGATGRPRWRRPRPDLVSTDLVERNFTRSGPNQLWVTDITEHHGRARCTARWCWTPTHVGSSGGPSTPRRPPRWSPTPSAWRSTPAPRRRVR